MAIHENSSHNTVTLVTSESDDDKLDRFKAELTDDADAMLDQREEAMLDLRFIKEKGGMWIDRSTSFSSDNFTENAEDSGLRVKLELDLVSPHVDAFLGEYSLNRVSVEFKPSDRGTTEEDSDLLNGLYRKDFRRNKGKNTTWNAVNEAVIMGYGAIKLTTAFEDEEDAENENMHVVFKSIYNAPDTVFWEKAAQEMDKSDANRCNVLQQHTKESFETTYPGKTAVSAYEPTNFAGAYNPAQGYTTGSDPTDIIFVSTRYEIVKRKEKRFVYGDLTLGKAVSFTEEQHEKIKDELRADDTKEFLRIREVIRRTVMMTVFSGEDILKPTRRIAGKNIPIIPFYGHRSYVNGREQYFGMVRKLVDAQRTFNAQISQMVENSMSMGQEVPIFFESQISGDDLEDMWGNRNNSSYLVLNDVKDGAGNIINQQIQYLKPPQLDGSTAALSTIIPDFMNAVKGELPKEAIARDMSGKLFDSIIKRINMKTQTIQDNIATAHTRIGQVYDPIAEEIYTTRRATMIINKEGVEVETLLLGLVMDQETGLEVEGANDLRGKKFEAFADVGPAYATLQEQAVEEMKGFLELFANMPGGEQYVNAVIPAMIENSSNTGMSTLKKLARDNQIKAGLVKPDTDDEKEMLEKFEKQKQEPDAEAKLVEAAAGKEDAERENLLKAAENKEQDTKLKAAQTDKEQAAAEKIHVDMAKILDELGDIRAQQVLDHEHNTNQLDLKREENEEVQRQAQAQEQLAGRQTSGSES